MITTLTQTKTPSVPIKDEAKTWLQIAEEAVAANPYLQKQGGVQGVMMIIRLANSLGIDPLIAIHGGINNINGKLEVSARQMNSLIRKRGHVMKLKICNNELCTLWGKRADTGEEMEATFTMEDARMASLIKPGGAWSKSPSDMLFCRALSRLARRLFADCIGEAYIEGELQEAIQKTVLQEAPQLPPPEDFALKEEEFKLPEGVDAKKVDEYFSVLQEQYSMGIDDIKKRAKENPEGFWGSFNKWAETK